MADETKLRGDDPRIVAWEAFKASEGFANTRRWALHEEYVEGSLWAAFLAGTAMTAHARPAGEDEVERVARALEAHANSLLPEWATPRPWGSYRGYALAALSAMNRDGVEITEAMVKDGELAIARLGLAAVEPLQPRAVAEADLRAALNGGAR